MLPYYAYRAAEALVRVLPRRAAYGLAVGCADVLRTVRPGIVRGLRANLAHVLPTWGRGPSTGWSAATCATWAVPGWT